MEAPMKVTEFSQETQTQTTVHSVEGKWVIQKTYDAEPYLDQASADRQATQHMRWGEGKKVGSVPMAVLGQFLRQDGGLDVKRLEAWLRDNPAFVSYEPFLKTRSKF